MLQRRKKVSANDNAPMRPSPIRNIYIRPFPVPVQNTAKTLSTDKVHAIAGWLVPLGAVLAAVAAFRQSTPLASMYLPSLILTSLLLLTAIISKANPRLRNISGVLMAISATTALAAFLAINGFVLVGIEVLLLLSTLSVLAGWAFKSNTSALLSVFASLLYLTSYYPELGLLTGISDKVSHLGAGILPWLILGQIFLAQQIKSPTVLLAAISAGYIWLTTLATGMLLPEMAGLGFAIAAAHYWLGKSRAENNFFGGEIHRLCAWVVALGSALYVQSIWLNTGAVQAQPYKPPNPIWWVILGSSVFTLFVISMQRYKASHISLFGIFVICAAVLILPATTVLPDLIYSGFDKVPGLNAHPGLGFVIGATVIAAGFYWLIGGLKSGQFLDMSIGALAVGIEAIILFKPENFNADLGVVFVVSLICALCIGGLIAGVTTDRSQTVDNYL